MRVFLRIVGVLLLAVMFVVTAEAVRDRSVREADRAAMRVGMEDVVRRVRTTTANLGTVIGLCNRAILSKAHALALLIRADPSLVDDQARFEALADVLEVEELHVSDEKGVLIRSLPAKYAGYAMGSSEQSRPFMRAIADKSFEMVQEPSKKGSDGQLFQYAGVARLDRPGIVQVGWRPERLETARKLADVDAIAPSMHVGRCGRVEMTMQSDADKLESGVRMRRTPTGREYVLESNVGAKRVRVLMPVKGSALADDIPFGVLCVVDVLIVLMLALTRFSSVKSVLVQNWHALSVLFRGLPGGSAGARRRKFLNVITISCAIAFAAAAVFCWACFSRASRQTAEKTLRAAARDMSGQLDACIDQQLFYQGYALCKSYGTPDAMSVDAVREVMKRYGLDELNVVDGRGVIVSGDLADVGFKMSSNPLSAKFNRLLEGETTYSQPFRGAIESPDKRRKYAGIAFPLPAKGYVQLGFDEKRIQTDLDYWFGDVARGWHIGKTGFFVVAREESGVIVSCGKTDAEGREVWKRGDTLAGVGFDVAAVPSEPATFFRARLYGEDCLCLHEMKNAHRFVTAMPVAEISEGGLKTSLMTIGMLFVVFFAVAVFMTRLSDLVFALKFHIADAASRVEKEMAMAKAIQSNVLPATFPPYPQLVDKIDVYARMLTAKEVGGDFYDFYFVGKNRLAVVIADVSGKGVPAALFMMRAKTTLQGLLKGGLAIDEAVGEANSRLAESNEANMFVTAWVGVVDLATSDVEFVNAGHNPPLVKRADGTVSYLTEKSGPPLAALGGISYRRKEMKLGVGDGLVLYTDGVTEAVNHHCDLYGESRLQETLKGLAGASDAEAVLRGVIDDVYAFSDGAEQADDITMLAFKLKGGVSA